MKRPEILAPAGSIDAFYAAVHAGADAVYVGGQRFGARAYANNFTTEELVHAIEYAHFYHCRVYLTVNTLVKEKEFNQLYEYLLPFYENGLDAVIVQDLGVASYIRLQFPELPIHASTQMTITSVSGARYLKKIGATRIVPARELSLDEICTIKENVDIEVETFVHGALCYCYSGQCLMSSMIGGRSGNRGRCAQPCRLPYELFDTDKRISDVQSSYLLSPKDMCTIEHIPQLVEAGIDSFKIEGRMKNPVYVATVVSMYRKYLDLYFNNPNKPYQVSKDDIITLMDSFNRGGFSNGYYFTHNGKELMSEKRPGHQGVLVAKVNGTTGPEVNLSVIESIHKGDRLEIIVDGEEPVVLTSSDSFSKGAMANLNGNRMREIKKGQEVYRTSNQVLIDRIENQFLLHPRKIEVEFSGVFSIGNPAQLTVKYQEFVITVFGDVIEKASKSPVPESQIREQLQKTGNTIYFVDRCNLKVDDQIFIPIKALKELRRKGLESLEQAISKHYARNKVERIQLPSIQEFDVINKPQELSVSIYQSCYLTFLLKKKEINRINIDYGVFPSAQWKSVVDRVHQHGKRIYCIFPRVMHHNIHEMIHKQEKEWLEAGFDGVIVGNIDSYAYITDELKWEGKLLLDYTMYQYNQSAISFYQKPSVLPVELNKQEMIELNHPNAEMILYGHLPIMISAGCLKKNATGCDGVESLLYLQDRYQNRFPVLNRCKYCYNVIYNSEPVYYFDLIEEYRSVHCKGYQMHLTVEELSDAEAIVDDGIQSICYQNDKMKMPSKVTRGHWKRGIE